MPNDGKAKQQEKGVQQVQPAPSLNPDIVRIKPDVYMAALLDEINEHLVELIDLQKGEGEESIEVMGEECRTKFKRPGEAHKEKPGEKDKDKDKDKECMVKLKPRGEECRVVLKKPAPSPSKAFQLLLDMMSAQLHILEEIRNSYNNISPTGTYFDTGQLLISIATPTKPTSMDSIADASAGITGYDKQDIFTVLRRKAQHLHIINDGPDTVYAIFTTDGKTWTDEIIIPFGEARTIWDVYEVRIRSPTLHNKYRMTEYDFWLTYTTTVVNVNVPQSPFANKPNFTARILNAPFGGNTLPTIAVPDGFALVVRANVDNPGNSRVFVGRNVADVAPPRVAGNYNTLAPGDDVRLFVTDASLVAVAGLLGTENVDITVEQT